MAKPKQLSWEKRLSRYLKAELKRADVTYEELARRLKAEGLIESQISIASKISRGSFRATFFCASLKVLHIEAMRIGDL